MKLITAFFFLFACAAHSETLSGYVVAISDGDTLTILDKNSQQHKIRLAGIDAPEKAQAFGDRSKQSLVGLTFNKNVTVDWSKQDRYGRTVGKIMVNGVDANLEQIKAGMAWWYRDYAKEQSPDDRAKYEHAELLAKLNKVGHCAIKTLCHLGISGALGCNLPQRVILAHAVEGRFAQTRKAGIIALHRGVGRAAIMYMLNKTHEINDVHWS